MPVVDFLIWTVHVSGCDMIAHLIWEIWTKLAMLLLYIWVLLWLMFKKSLIVNLSVNPKMEINSLSAD
jgi:hypothetical protein